jgi:SAM-dependent methyltransferase
MRIAAAAREPNWYLDPLVAQQKRELHLRWIARNVPATSRIRSVLKTDLFEEAYGRDELLFTLPFDADLKIGLDLDGGTVVRAESRGHGCCFLNADVRHLPLGDGCLDVVLSNSTLDHFVAEQDIEQSLRELARVLKTGGILLVTLDNPRNPLFLLFRAAVGWLGLSYPLGKTLSRRKLLRMLNDAGLEAESTDWLIHNPRFVSTLLFLALRRMLGAGADGSIRWLLAAFSRLGHLPTRGFTGAFVGACARKPGQQASPALQAEPSEFAIVKS